MAEGVEPKSATLVPQSGRGVVSASVFPLLAALLLFLFALFQALGTNNLPDFFIYRLGAELAARGENPYDIARIREHVVAQFPDPAPKADSFVNNCGYFLPPMAVLVFLPFAALPLVAAKAAWAIAVGLGGYFIARLPERLRSSDAQPLVPLAQYLLPFALVLNPLMLAVVVVGQVTIVTVGCVAAGLWAFDRRRPYLGALLWVVPFIKPHVAIPLIALAWYLGGWKPAASLVALVGLLNLAGATVVGGSPLFLRDYIDYLPTARDAVVYNRVELNPSFTSWNRLLFAWGGPLFELSVASTLAGNVVWFGLVLGRCAVTRARPSAAWAAAAATAGGLFCSQVLVYEMLFLAVAVPWMRDLFLSGFRLRGLIAVLLLVVQLVPQRMMETLRLADTYHPLAIALVAMLILTGPIESPRLPLASRG